MKKISTSTTDEGIVETLEHNGKVYEVHFKPLERGNSDGMAAPGVWTYVRFGTVISRDLNGKETKRVSFEENYYLKQITDAEANEVLKHPLASLIEPMLDLEQAIHEELRKQTMTHPAQFQNVLTAVGSRMDHAPTPQEASITSQLREVKIWGYVEDSKITYERIPIGDVPQWREFFEAYYSGKKTAQDFDDYVGWLGDSTESERLIGKFFMDVYKDEKVRIMMMRNFGLGACGMTPLVESADLPLDERRARHAAAVAKLGAVN